MLSSSLARSSAGRIFRAPPALSPSRSSGVNVVRPRSQVRSVTAATRTMATSTGKKLEWLAVIPDHEGAIQKRLEVRSKHLEGVMPLHAENKIVMGGAFFSHPPAEGETPPPMIGSALVVYAETKEEVMQILEKDIYNTSGVWDLSKIQIWPFKSAVRSDISATA
ncbi:hypothetical protein, variant 2 [Verruconis gallopava]|uniref:YCII-related domain-containing protein n=1 Tax=Verruconis gallopava TaxID=253628 RepID=A0A0D1XRJ7_9PEZI|nr:uncharacterized protein PV09_03840 [Verruconis gallopava]XP_016215186.1 hypothetical protein, variant 1 [Verruconis gallopava]XP_016215187.1 hypothetical protein, variant 2 [Verruconis gallopava]KIW05316.1 hypothetical protein PV09_03840 [Verruconis gallopava]KIW05317.1 hypothetical protein, variant 1 [Verruconis gallopava]KIW05318.1 hypothetical protein, variant 2 [Verruconis gallopava]